jgi:hypothetical protein
MSRNESPVTVASGNKNGLFETAPFFCVYPVYKFYTAVQLLFSTIQHKLWTKLAYFLISVTTCHSRTARYKAIAGMKKCQVTMNPPPPSSHTTPIESSWKFATCFKNEKGEHACTGAHTHTAWGCRKTFFFKKKKKPYKKSLNTTTRKHDLLLVMCAPAYVLTRK